MHSWDNKDNGGSKGQNGTADAMRKAIDNPPANIGSSEPDDEPVRDLKQIHKDLGRHVPNTTLGTEEPDGSPLPGDHPKDNY